MRHFAALNGEDPDLWGVVGLLHDLDYEQYPDQHCAKVQEILGEKGVDEAVIRAVASHGYGMCSDIPAGENPLHHRRALRPYHRRRPDAPLPQRDGYRGKKRQEEV